MTRVEFSQSGAEWIAMYKGRVIASIPITGRQTQPPRWFKQTARQYIKETLKKVM